ncbi:MAG TPA: hypothetical protein VE242_09685 [Chthoniobacterales bacterium]|nr:hypothetical protein [Chthoniobacterales bacterium]
MCRKFLVDRAPTTSEIAENAEIAGNGSPIPAVSNVEFAVGTKDRADGLGTCEQGCRLMW